MKKGIPALITGFALIAGGVLAKRIFHHSDFLIFLHIFGAAFLIFAFIQMAARKRGS